MDPAELARFVERHFPTIVEVLAVLPRAGHDPGSDAVTTRALLHGTRTRYDRTFVIYAWGGAGFAAVAFHETAHDETHRAQASGAPACWTDTLEPGPFRLRHARTDPICHLVEEERLAPLNRARVPVLLVRAGESPRARVREFLLARTRAEAERIRDWLGKVPARLEKAGVRPPIDWQRLRTAEVGELCRGLEQAGELLKNHEQVAGLDLAGKYRHPVFQVGMGLVQMALALGSLAEHIEQWREQPGSGGAG